jgi:hypothetical protein
MVFVVKMVAVVPGAGKKFRLALLLMSFVIPVFVFFFKKKQGASGTNACEYVVDTKIDANSTQIELKKNSYERVVALEIPTKAQRIQRSITASSIRDSYCRCLLQSNNNTNIYLYSPALYQ